MTTIIVITVHFCAAETLTNFFKREMSKNDSQYSFGKVLSVFCE